MDFVMNIFRYKTVPAFEVSLMLGLSCTGNFAHLRPMLKTYSEALGIAYQLKDDLEDISQDIKEVSKPTAALALKTEHPEWSPEEVKVELKRLTDLYHQQALDALTDLEELELKRLLYQVTEKILN